MVASRGAWKQTTAGLRNRANAALIYNLLRDVPPGGQILFDVYHPGFTERPSQMFVRQDTQHCLG